MQYRLHHLLQLVEHILQMQVRFTEARLIFDGGRLIRKLSMAPCTRAHPISSPTPASLIIPLLPICASHPPAKRHAACADSAAV